MPKRKYYVVWKGRKTGVFMSWAECEEQVKGFVGAEYKAFGTLKEAEAAFRSKYEAYKGKSSSSGKWKDASVKPIFSSICVDAASSGSFGKMEYRGVFLESGEFARYAYEVYVVPRRRVPHVFALTEAETESLARALRHVTVGFDNLWRMSFPYVQVLHQAPTDSGDYGAYHFYIAFHPPLRQPNLLKYLAGPEVGGGNFLSDTSPEDKAAELKALPDTHYKAAPAAPEGDAQ
jgi:hypothetical protein